jgi:hypothetical protein
MRRVCLCLDAHNFVAGPASKADEISGMMHPGHVRPPSRDSPSLHASQFRSGRLVPASGCCDRRRAPKKAPPGRGQGWDETGDRLQTRMSQLGRRKGKAPVAWRHGGGMAARGTGAAAEGACGRIYPSWLGGAKRQPARGLPKGPCRGRLSHAVDSDRA